MEEDDTFVYNIEDGESISEAILTAVSSISGVEVTNLEPLYTVIDPDALNALFGSYSDGTPRDGKGIVVFSYESYQVTVQPDQTILVSEPKT
ncbi:HalOD1 output domain-containing protein [Haladaptatus pallidirubidus]|uniref:Halobacterial output domain-containing protein n=1 Tax=Haladaptatus pallidirubidus TaxID=1008152 RepID=A0AAV3UIK1_9EURY|nr:HalOD1 output domain-containing protein [Haladaptatus pallidirubidus]